MDYPYPVVDDHSGDDDDYLELLRNGFVLKWNATNCSNCNAHKETRLAVILGTVIPGACIIPFLGVLFILWRRKKSKHRSLEMNTSSDIEYGFGIHVFSYKELQEATHNFDASKQLGEGGFGTVYYGKKVTILTIQDN